MIKDVATEGDLAWAAGFFDGDGSVGASNTRGRPSLVASISQKGEAGPPETLLRFQAVVGTGKINGPFEGKMFHWWCRGPALAAALALLCHHLGQVKREAFYDALERARIPRPTMVEDVAGRDHDLAWAAGFFDAEGCTTLDKRALRLGPRVNVRLSIGQASPEGIPPPLLRFQAAVGAGSIRGPQKKEGRQDMYRWRVAGLAGSERVLQLLWPHLGTIKKSQASRALEAERGQPPPRHVGRPGWRKTRCVRGHAYEDCFERIVLRNGRPIHVRICRKCTRERYRARRSHANLRQPTDRVSSQTASEGN